MTKRDEIARELENRECKMCGGLIVWLADEEEWQHVRPDTYLHRADPAPRKEPRNGE